MVVDWETKLKNILERDISSLTDNDIAFLRARRSYLTSDQQKVYQTILTETQKTYQELMSECKRLGYKVKVGLTRKQLEEMIESTKVL